MRRGGLLLALAAALVGAPPASAAVRPEYEVWVIDQSDTRPDGGGTLYIYRGQDLTGPGGASALTRMPSAAHSTASARVRLTTPPFDAA